MHVLVTATEFLLSAANSDAYIQLQTVSEFIIAQMGGLPSIILIQILSF